MVARRVAFFILLTCVLLVPRAGQAQGLNFFKNYFVTGDFAAAGVSLRGTGGTGVIDMTSANVPANADILAAFLYWQTVLNLGDGIDQGTTGAAFHGQSLSVMRDGVSYSIAKALNPAGIVPCWSPEGSTGAVSVTFRADVHRFLEQDPVTGKLRVNTTHEVTLPEAVDGPSTSGATLVVIYRDPTKPLKAVVMIDGGVTKDDSVPMLSQIVAGYYQPASNPAARMTHIVSDGPVDSEQVLFNDVLVSGVNPFSSAWGNPTFTIPTTVLGTGATGTVKVLSGESACRSWAAMVFSTAVKDTDEDGLPDIWESSDVPLPDPNGGFLPNLKAMGANPQVQDIFVEVGFMSTDGYANAAQTVLAHSHLPAKSVFETVAIAFHNATARKRRAGGNISGPINVHFDVGANHQDGLPSVAQCKQTWVPSCAIVPLSAGARGGDEISETIGCRSDESGNVTCGGRFPNYPGTVGWKSGFQLLKNQPLGYASPVMPGDPSIEEQCAADDNCERRFDLNRKDIFRYALFAHALGLVRVDATGTPVLDSTGERMPKNTSGIGDGGGVGGGDLMVTLGFWDNYTGNPFMVGSTLTHEMGHGFGLRHGGGPPIRLADGRFVPQPNCKVNFLSIMNYLFQVRGLIDASGNPTIDYSKQALSQLREDRLNENLSSLNGWNAMTYRTSWYAPLSSVSGVTGTVTRHCDGTFFTTGEPFVRVNGTNTNGRMDWNQDGDATDVNVSQDVNFNSVINSGVGDRLRFDGFNDFQAMDLRQLGGRRNSGSERIGGALSLGVGFGDVGFGDVGFGDVGFGDVGFGDVGFGDVGAPPGDLDLDTAAVLNAPNSLTVALLPAANHLAWTAPHVGTVEGYNVYRVKGPAVTSSSVIFRLGTTFPTTTSTSFDDTDVIPGGEYTYFVVALLSDGSTTGASNFVTVIR